MELPKYKNQNGFSGRVSHAKTEKGLENIFLPKYYPPLLATIRAKVIKSYLGIFKYNTGKYTVLHKEQG